MPKRSNRNGRMATVGWGEPRGRALAPDLLETRRASRITQRSPVTSLYRSSRCCAARRPSRHRASGGEREAQPPPLTARHGEAGIRCCYPGWMYDVDGRILETPGEPVTSTLKDRLCQGAYPLHEYCGLIFAYMGRPERKPVFPLYDTFDLPGLTLMPAGKFSLPCNWLQIKDNSMDPVHTSFLHAISSGYQFTEAFGALAELDWEETPYGMTYIATRRLGDLVWVRVADFMAPNVHQFTREFEDVTQEKAASRPVVIRWAVPIDDTHTWNMELAQVDPG